MDINTSNRETLKSYFKKGAMPTEANFAELIDGLLNQADDGLAKRSGEPLSLQAGGDATTRQKVLNFYKSFKDSAPAWTLSLNPLANPDDANSASPGWSIGDAECNSRLFIDASGNVGLGTAAPAAALEIRRKMNKGLGPVLRLTNTGGQLGAGAAIDFNGYETPAGKDPTARIQSFDDGSSSSHLLFLTKKPGDRNNALVEALSIASNGDVALQKKHALRANDTWLRLNQESHFSSGVHTPGLFAANSLAVGGTANPGTGNLATTGGIAVGGDISVQKKHAIRGSDTWLRLNQDKAFSSGVHTEGLFSAMSLNIGGANNYGDPGGGNVSVAGNVTVSGRVYAGSLTGGLFSGNGKYALYMQDDRNLCIYTSGQHGAAWCSNSHVSDLNLKKDVKLLDGALEKVQRLRGVAFSWKEKELGEEPQIGVVAQDVEKVFPELVMTIDERKMVKYQGLIPVLIEAVKEQQTQLGALRAQVRKLERELAHR